MKLLCDDRSKGEKRRRKIEKTTMQTDQTRLDQPETWHNDLTQAMSYVNGGRQCSTSTAERPGRHAVSYRHGRTDLVDKLHYDVRCGNVERGCGAPYPKLSLNLRCILALCRTGACLGGRVSKAWCTFARATSTLKNYKRNLREKTPVQSDTSV